MVKLNEFKFELIPRPPYSPDPGHERLFLVPKLEEITRRENIVNKCRCPVWKKKTYLTVGTNGLDK